MLVKHVTTVFQQKHYIVSCVIGDLMPLTLRDSRWLAHVVTNGGDAGVGNCQDIVAVAERIGDEIGIASRRATSVIDADPIHGEARRDMGTAAYRIEDAPMAAPPGGAMNGDPGATLEWRP